jgi:hypothetical protein
VSGASVARPAAADLLSLARGLESATSASDLVDVLATGAGAKPLAGVTLCYTADGHPAWDAVDTGPDALGRDALGPRLDALGFEWRRTPVGAGTEDREYRWYDLLLALPDTEGAGYLETAPAQPSARDARTYGRALGYPDSAIDWFDRDAGRTALEVVRAARPDDLAAVTLAACVPYVPAPTLPGAADAVADGRRLVDALCRVGTEAGEPWYVRSLLSERVRGRLPRERGRSGALVEDALTDAMPC